MKLMKRKQPDTAVAMRGDRHGLLDEALTREVIGAFYKVYNTLGHGFLESVYSRALYIELRRRGLSVRREVTVTAFYEQYPVGHFRAISSSKIDLPWSSRPGGQPCSRTANNFRASNLTLAFPSTLAVAQPSIG